jgi:hypothetical protein
MNNPLNLPEINQEQALNLSKFFIKSEQNIFLFGRRGVGKTHIAMQAAQELDHKISYINLSVIERPDLAGYPDLNSNGDVITFKSPYYLPTLNQNKNDKYILLFDEVDKAAPEVTAPLLEILQFRKINGNPINIKSCILTGNLVNEGAYSNIISPALLDRGAKYILSFNFEKWIDWAKSHDVHDLVMGFLRANSEFACGKIDSSCYASPSPRGWTQASEALLKAKELKITDIESVTQIISGFVGEEAGINFKIWYKHYRQFEPHVKSLIEQGNLTLDFAGLKPTEQLVFVITACYFAKLKVLTELSKTKSKLQALENLIGFFQQNKVDKEMQVMGLYNSFNMEMIVKHKLYTYQLFFDYFKHLNEDVSINK